MIITTSGKTVDGKGYSQISVCLLRRRIEDFALKCKVLPPTFSDQRENVRVARVVSAHVCAFAILIGTCVWDVLEHMALVDATATVRYAQGLHNAYKYDYGTKDCFARHFCRSQRQQDQSVQCRCRK